MTSPRKKRRKDPASERRATIYWTITATIWILFVSSFVLWKLIPLEPSMLFRILTVVFGDAGIIALTATLEYTLLNK